MADPLAPDAITALIENLRVDSEGACAIFVGGGNICRTCCGDRRGHRLRQAGDALYALSAQVERLQVLNDQVAAMGVTDCERADAAEAQIATLTAAARTVLDTFTTDEAQGYRTKDRRFVIEILGQALAAQPTRETSEPHVLPHGDGDSG